MNFFLKLSEVKGLLNRRTRDQDVVKYVRTDGIVKLDDVVRDSEIRHHSSCVSAHQFG
jgi:hypothetical protein